MRIWESGERTITITDCPPGTECVVYVRGKEVGRGIVDEAGDFTCGLGELDETMFAVVFGITPPRSPRVHLHPLHGADTPTREKK